MNEKILNKTAAKAHQKKIKFYLLISTVPICLYHSLATKDYWALIFISCLALYAPILWMAFAFFLAIKAVLGFRESSIAQRESVQNSIVQSVQMNRLDDLSKAIEENPEILYCDYQRRSLTAWCRYYKNTKALELITEMMKKYPKEEVVAA